MENQLPFHLQLRYERELRGWSQADVAKKVGSDVKTVGRWESGLGVPRPYYRQKLYEIFGKNAQAMGLLGQSTHTTNLPFVSTRSALPTDDIEILTARVVGIVEEASSSMQRQEDWGEAPHSTTVYGRMDERARLLGWIQQDRCRVVAVLGIGGVGKTVLLSAVAEQGKATFDAVFWRSLQNAPPPEQFLKSAVSFLSQQQHVALPEELDDLVALLMQTLQHHRCLLVIDNFESVLQSGLRTGHYQAGYEGYGKLLQRVSEVEHGSCLLLTSREKPKEIASEEGKQSLVRTLTLTGVGYKEGQEILQEKELVGSEQAWRDLIRLYSGNPLALKLVGQSIQEVFGGQIAHFLVAEEGVFGDVTDLLDQQFRRLSLQEQNVLTWLAIEREAVALETLREDMLQSVSAGALIETLVSLMRRSLIEARESTLFTLQPVVMEYITILLVQRAYTEFQLATSDTWKSYALIKAQAKDYVRANQIRLILAPIAQHILTTMSREAFEEQIRHMLDAQRNTYQQQRAHVAGNILNLLVYLHYDLHAFDFSHLTIQQAYLQHATLSGANFTSAHFISSVFTNTFGNVLSVALSSDGTLLAAGVATGEIWVYDLESGTLVFSCTGHTDGVWAVAFSPDMQLLASSSDDQSVRLWSVGTGECVRVFNGHTDRVRSVAFHPNGDMLASGSDDTQCILWEVKSGSCLDILRGHTDRVWSIAFSHDGRMLATGSTDQTILLWDIASRSSFMTLSGHTNAIRSLAFSSDDHLIVSGSDDRTLMLWDVQRGTRVTTFRGHVNRVWSVAFHGDTIASGSEDQTICIWDSHTGQRVRTLHGHTHGVRSVVFSDQAPLLVSGGDDQTIRVWETNTGQCLKTVQGYTNRIWSVLFTGDGNTLVSISEDQAIRVWDRDSGKWKRTMREQGHGLRSIAATMDGTLLASGGEDQTVRLWNPTTGQQLRILRGHTDWVGTVAFSSDGGMLASGSEDTTVRLWETGTGHCLHILQGHSSWVRSVSFRPDGHILASCGDDQMIRLWHVERGECLLTLEGHTARIRSLTFHPNGQHLISGGEDQTIRIWDCVTGQCLQVLQGHTGRVRTVAYSPDGSMICSGSDDQTVRLWNSMSGQCLLVLQGHTHRVRWVAFEPQGQHVASSSDDGSIKLWNIQTARCIQTLLNERPYEQMNIAHVQGLTETQKTTLRLLGAVEDA